MALNLRVFLNARWYTIPCLTSFIILKETEICISVGFRLPASKYSSSLPKYEHHAEKQSQKA